MTYKIYNFVKNKSYSFIRKQRYQLSAHPHDIDGFLLPNTKHLFDNLFLSGNDGHFL